TREPTLTSRHNCGVLIIFAIPMTCRAQPAPAEVHPGLILARGAELKKASLDDTVPDTFQLGAICRFLRFWRPKKSMGCVFSTSLNIPTPRLPIFESFIFNVKLDSEHEN